MRGEREREKLLIPPLINLITDICNKILLVDFQLYITCVSLAENVTGFKLFTS